MTRHRRRRGVALMIALAVLTLLLVLAALLTRAAVHGQRETRFQERRLQADFLAEAGLERAVAQLQKVPQYPGETWHVSASDSGLDDDCDILIKLRENSAGGLQLEITAHLGMDEWRVTAARELSIAKATQPEATVQD
jgi:type II secretory pathway component PulK